MRPILDKCSVSGRIVNGTLRSLTVVFCVAERNFHLFLPRNLRDPEGQGLLPSDLSLDGTRTHILYWATLVGCGHSYY